jgi:hypothetical protein
VKRVHDSLFHYSGSGKSVLLKTLEKDIKQDMQVTSINVADIKPEPDKPLIETVGNTTEEALELLSRVGLNDPPKAL